MVYLMGDEKNMFLKKIWRFLREERPARTVWKSLIIQFCLEMGLFFFGFFSKDMQVPYWLATLALVKLATLYSNKPVARIVLYTEYFGIFCFLMFFVK